MTKLSQTSERVNLWAKRGGVEPSGDSRGIPLGLGSRLASYCVGMGLCCQGSLCPLLRAHWREWAEGRGGSVVEDVVVCPSGCQAKSHASPCDIFTAYSCVFRNRVGNEAARLEKAGGKQTTRLGSS